jgi:hypothetical protein
MEHRPNLETTILGRPAVVDVLYEHFEEVAHLSVQWRKLIFSPEIPLRRLASHADRIEAHVDGLRVGGAAAVGMAEALLAGDDAWLVFSAARCWLEQGQGTPAVLEKRLQATPPELRGAWKEAFRRLPVDVCLRAFPQTNLTSLTPEALEVACDARGYHQILSKEVRDDCAQSSQPLLRAAVARHAPDVDLLQRLLQDKDVMVRRVALWSLALQNASFVLGQCRRWAESEPDAFALRVIGLFGDRNDGARLLPLLQQKSLAVPALLALRDLGSPEFAASVLSIMEADAGEIAPVAQQVFESLVGRSMPAKPSEPDPTPMSPARRHWEQFRSRADLTQRRLSGVGFPWSGPVADEPMEALWRRALSNATVAPVWLRREVPDGFFSGVGAVEAIPGE